MDTKKKKPKNKKRHTGGGRFEHLLASMTLHEIGEIRADPERAGRVLQVLRALESAIGDNRDVSPSVAAFEDLVSETVTKNGKKKKRKKKTGVGDLSKVQKAARAQRKKNTISGLEAVRTVMKPGLRIQNDAKLRERCAKLGFVSTSSRPQSVFGQMLYKLTKSGEIRMEPRSEGGSEAGTWYRPVGL